MNKSDLKLPGYLAVLLAVGSALVFDGCGNGQAGNETAAANLAGNSVQPTSKTTALGTAQAAGAFQVTLSTDKPLVAGKTLFHATVMQQAKPVKNATVKLNLSMPSMSMGGPEVVLKPSGDQYMGSADVMEGDYQAVVMVSNAGASGTATYSFTVK